MQPFTKKSVFKMQKLDLGSWGLMGLFNYLWAQMNRVTNVNKSMSPRFLLNFIASKLGFQPQGLRLSAQAQKRLFHTTIKFMKFPAIQSQRKPIQ